MTLYSEMNNKIVDLLRMGDTPVELYAAQRIEELELKNKELIDRILEIIDKYATYIFGNGLSEENQIALWDDMRDKVLALKGEQE